MKITAEKEAAIPATNRIGRNNISIGMSEGTGLCQGIDLRDSTARRESAQGPAVDDEKACASGAASRPEASCFARVVDTPGVRFRSTRGYKPEPPSGFSNWTLAREACRQGMGRASR